MPNEVLGKLYNAGVDLFYVMTGKSIHSDDALKWSAFECSIADLSLDDQDTLRGLM